MNQDSAIRPVRPLKAPDLQRSPAGDKPELEWLPLDRLVINDNYQRSLSEKSVRIIRKIVENFDWGRIKALSVTKVEGGLYEVIDGQHTAIAAATHGGVSELPCVITSERSEAERAADFVGLNRDRLTMTPMQVFFAEVRAGDESALDAMAGVKAAGGRVLKGAPSYGKFEPGDVVAVGALKRIAAEGGVAYVKRVMAIGVAAKCAPVKSQTLLVLQALIWGGREQLGDDTIVDVLRLYGQEALIERARYRRKESGASMTRELEAVIREVAADERVATPAD